MNNELHALYFSPLQEGLPDRGDLSRRFHSSPEAGGPAAHPRSVAVSRLAAQPRDPRCRRSSFKPDLVCFSWRDIQIFSPHEGDLRWSTRLIFILPSNPIKRVVASFAGLKQLYRYYSHIHAILSYPWLVAKGIPQGPDHDRRRSLYRLRRSADREIAGRHHRHSRRGRRCDPKGASKAGRLEDERYIIREGKQITKGTAGLAGAARRPHRRPALSDLDFSAIP